MVPNRSGEGIGVFEAGGRSRRVLDLIANRWAVLVIYALSEGTKRRNRLQREVESVSQKMLTKTLRNLERDGLLRREVYPVVPPKVEYSLTPLGTTLIGILVKLCRWADEHIEEVEATRADYDARSGEASPGEVREGKRQIKEL